MAHSRIAGTFQVEKESKATICAYVTDLKMHF